MVKYVDAQELKRRLSQPAELALVDVREFGQYGEGHPFLSVNAPYSVLELTIGKLVPLLSAPIVMFDQGDGVAERAERRLADMGYSDLSILQGGAPAWAAAGYTLFKGVNLPSKTLGEMVEETLHTPHLTVEQLRETMRSDNPPLLLDGRSEAEYRSFTIPGAESCPNAELGLRVPESVPADRPIVIHCAGRTRSIIGAETVRALGLPNPVAALENGTQGWVLAGYERETGADRIFAPLQTPEMRSAARALAGQFCARHNIARIDATAMEAWQADADRTLYLLDVRSKDEFEAGTVAGATHAPGGQLIQATDHWLGVRNARVVVWDDNEIRAAFAAFWLARMGWPVSVLVGEVAIAAPAALAAPVPDIDRVGVKELALSLEQSSTLKIDARPSQTYREGHLEAFSWGIRPNVTERQDIRDADVLIICSDFASGALMAAEVLEAGASRVRLHKGDIAEWRTSGLSVIATPDNPPDPACIDHLFFVANRHAGDQDHARAYLAWEQGLTKQLDNQERAIFDLLSS